MVAAIERAGREAIHLFSGMIGVSVVKLAGVSSSTDAAGRRGYGPSMPGTMAIPAPTAYRCPVPTLPRP